MFLQPTLQSLAWPLGLLAIGLVLLGLGVRRLLPELRRYRREPIDVYEASQASGPVGLRGTVRPHEHVLEAGFTGIDCVAFRYEVEAYRSGGRGSSWETIASGGQFAPFRLEDDTGSILVEPHGDEITFDGEWSIEVDRDETVQGRPRAFLESERVEPGAAGERSIGPLSFGTGDRRRYTETRLEPGDPVAVDGPTEYDPDAARAWGSGSVNAAVRSKAETPVVVAAGDRIPLLRGGVGRSVGLILGGLALFGYGSLVLLGVW